MNSFDEQVNHLMELGFSEREAIEQVNLEHMHLIHEHTFAN